MGYQINETIHGIVVGFVCACLVKEEGWLAFLLGMKRVISTPQWLIQLVSEDSIEGNVITKGLVNGGEDTNIPYWGITLESGANVPYHATTIGDVTFIQSQIDQVESVTLAADIVGPLL